MLSKSRIVFSNGTDRHLWPRPLKLRELGEGVRKEDSGALRHAKVTTTLDLYFQSIDAAKLEAQEDIALAITSTAAAD